MRLEFHVCTCHWMTHPPSQLAAIPGAGNAGRGGAGAAAEGRDRHSPSSSSRPSVPSTSFNPGDRAVWKECPTVAGLLASHIQVCPGSCSHPQSGASRSSAPTDSSPEWRRAAAAVEAKVGVSPAMPPSQRVCEDGSVCCCLPEELCFQRAACVYRGLGSPQISGAFFTGGRHRP